MLLFAGPAPGSLVLSDHLLFSRTEIVSLRHCYQHVYCMPLSKPCYMAAYSCLNLAPVYSVPKNCGPNVQHCSLVDTLNSALLVLFGKYTHMPEYWVLSLKIRNRAKLHCRCHHLASPVVSCCGCRQSWQLTFMYGGEVWQTHGFICCLFVEALNGSISYLDSMLLNGRCYMIYACLDSVHSLARTAQLYFCCHVSTVTSVVAGLLCSVEAQCVCAVTMTYASFSYSCLPSVCKAQPRCPIA